MTLFQELLSFHSWMSFRIFSRWGRTSLGLATKTRMSVPFRTFFALPRRSPLAAYTTVDENAKVSPSAIPQGATPIIKEGMSDYVTSTYASFSPSPHGDKLVAAVAFRGRPTEGMRSR
jgi:hypothetical protein